MDLFASIDRECLISVAGFIVLLFYLPGLFCGKFKDSHDIIAGLMLHLTERKWVSVWGWFWVWVGSGNTRLFTIDIGQWSIRRGV